MHRIAILIALAAVTSVGAQETAANWIWYPEIASGECIDETRYLRKTFEAPDGVASAVVDLVVDDRHDMFANGEGPLEPIVRKGEPLRYDIAGLLRPGRNVIAVEVHNVTGPAGAIGRLMLEGADGKTTIVGTDDTWRASREAADGWTTADFDDSDWVAAKTIGPAFTRPWMDFPGYHAFKMITEEELAAYREFQDSILAPAEQFADEQPARAQLRHHNGAPAMFIDDVPQPAVMYRGTVDPASAFGRRQITNFRNADVHLHCLYTTLMGCWRGPDEYDFSQVDGLIRSYLSADPEAHLLLQVRIIPPEWWMKAHPDEWVAYGTSDKLDSSDEARRVRRASPASEVWLEETGEAWRAIIRHIEDQPWGKRVIGYHAGYGIYSEWHYFGGWTDQYPDTGAAMTRTFRKWLREKYGTVEALRKAWRDEQVSFANAAVPGVEPRKTATLGTLRDPALERPVIDYYHCQQEVIADDVEFFGRISKEEAGEQSIYGVYYGYSIGVRPQTQGGHLELERLLKSPVIDYFVAPYGYAYRLMGQDGRLRSLAAAINAAGKVHLIEADIRTYLHSRNEYGRTENLTESLAAIRREFTSGLIEHTGFWYVDFGPGIRGGWFDHPAMVAEEKALQKVAVESLNIPREPVAEIAVVCDLESGYMLSDAEGMSQAYWLTEKIGTELYHVGAPLDWLFLSQLQDADLSRYKLIVFLNTIQMTPDQADVVTKLRQEGRHGMVFAWMPGICTPDEISVGQASRVTGLDLSLMKQWLPAEVEVSGEAASVMTTIPSTTRFTIETAGSEPVPECADTGKWYNPRDDRQMKESYTKYEVEGIEGGIAWSFETSYRWTDVHLGADIPEGDGVGFDVRLEADCSRLMLRTVIKDANWAEFVTQPEVIIPADWRRLEFPLEAFANAAWSKLKPEKPALPLRGMKFVLDGTNTAGRCIVSIRDLASVNGKVATTEVRSYGDGVFTPALIPSGDHGQVLGRLAGTGLPAVVLTDGPAPMLYSAAPFIPRELLLEAMHRAGVHRYIHETGDVVRADSRYIAIHTKEGGERTLRLPEACAARDAITGEELGRGTAIKLQLPPDSTTLLERLP